MWEGVAYMKTAVTPTELLASNRTMQVSISTSVGRSEAVMAPLATAPMRLTAWLTLHEVPGLDFEWLHGDSLMGLPVYSDPTQRPLTASVSNLSTAAALLANWRESL
jgi:hypothetical protein